MKTEKLRVNIASILGHRTQQHQQLLRPSITRTHRMDDDCMRCDHCYCWLVVAVETGLVSAAGLRMMR
ncbi:hypothetical protein BaRGS_00004721 [Batillaria attramentaria]|uniref:Uncharacterized protein n=1 Tax=Batillaria attramentaria TaxID=370345 RepID=A0ABD0LWI2_9CAEN